MSDQLSFDAEPEPQPAAPARPDHACAVYDPGCVQCRYGFPFAPPAASQQFERATPDELAAALAVQPAAATPRAAPLTTRERRERRAERLRDWADARGTRQASLDQAARADEAATGIPFGQPILVGHHSERRHRNAIARIDRAMAASVDNSRKAASMAGRANEIERQLNASIYDDDPDALDRLRAKLEALEAKRERIKAANAAYRREHKAELKAMTPYQRDHAMPFRSYELANLGGVISTTRKRIERLSRPVEAERGRWLEARYPGTCRTCGADVARGDRVLYFKRARAVECAPCGLGDGGERA